jgi:hypothetical protein
MPTTEDINVRPEATFIMYIYVVKDALPLFPVLINL